MNATNQTANAFASLTINGEPKQEIQVPRTLRPFKNLDEIDVIAINKVVLDVVPVEQNQIKIGLAWLFEVENLDLDGMITINHPNVTLDNDVEYFALASLKMENDTWIITIYDNDDIIMEFSFKLD